MMPMMSWFGDFYGLFTSFVLILLGAAAGVVILTVVLRPNRGTDDGEELLRMRYAAGEIDTEEYRKRLTALRAAHGAPR